MPAHESRSDAIRRLLPAVILAVLAVAALSLRATFGITPLDDGHYPATALHLMHGAVPFTDELTLQVLGFVPAVPAAKLWTSLFGMTGVVLALRFAYILYVVAAGAVVVWALRPVFGAVRPLLAFSVIMLAPPYNIVSVSYNTSTTLFFLLAVSLAMGAVHRRSAVMAAAAGVFAALGTATYPPLVFAAIVLATATALVSRDRRVVLGIFGGGLVTAGVIAGVLLSMTSIASLQRTLAYGATFSIYGSTAQKIARVVGLSRAAVFRKQMAPLYALAIVASIPVLPRRIRGSAAALIPLGAVLPGIWRLAMGGDGRFFGTYPAAFVTTLAIGLALPVIVWAVTERPKGLGQLLVIAGSTTLVAVPLVAFSTSSGFYYAILSVGFAPALLALLIGWGDMIEVCAGRAVTVAAWTFTIAVAASLLLGQTFKDVPIWRADTRIKSGALAGIATSRERMYELESLSTAAAPYVTSNDYVTAFGGGTAYLLTQGKELAPITWMNPGPGDQYVVDYFAERRQWPKAIIIPQGFVDELSRVGGYDQRTDPMLVLVRRDYRLVWRGPYYDLYVRR